MKKIKATIAALPLLLLAVVLGITACGGSPTSPSSGNGAARGPQTFVVSPSGNDRDAGTLAAPWQTLAHAVGQLRAGDTLYLRGGTYGDLLELTSTASGTSWEKPVTIAPYQNEQAVITGWTGADHIVQLGTGAAYIILDRLVIDGRMVAGVTADIVLDSTSHHIRLRQLEVRNAVGNGVFGGGSLHEFLSMNVHTNGWLAEKANGMYLTTDGAVVEGGDFYDNLCYGVRFFDSDAASSADDNSVRLARLYGNGSGRGLGGAGRCTSGGGGVVLGDVGNLAEKNEIDDNAEGILVFATKRTGGVRLYGNTLRRNGIGITVQAGAADTDVKDNTLDANGIGLLDFGAATTLVGNGPQ